MKTFVDHVQTIWIPTQGTENKTFSIERSSSENKKGAIDYLLREIGLEVTTKREQFEA